MRYLFIALLAVTLTFKDGHKESYGDCYMGTAGGFTKPIMLCVEHNMLWHGKETQVSIFDIERADWL